MEEIVKNEFEFYSRLAKPLVLNLPKSKDRILAAAWIKKFRDEASGEEKLRTTYLKLMLFCLQRRKLSGIFADDPMNYSSLENLPSEIDLNEFARNLLEQEQMDRRETIRREMIGDMDAFPAYTTDCSPDLTEYVAAQDIPNFGVHVYYAISKQPINKWQRSEKAILPKGTKSAIETTITAAAAAVPSCVCEPKGTASAPEVEEQPEGEADEPACKKKKKDKGPEKKKRRPKKLGASPPSQPIGEVRQPTEERPTPTWGTNLLEVRLRTQIGHIEEPSDNMKALEEEVAKLLAEEEDEKEEEPEERETISDKTKEMMHVLDEFKHGKMDKPKPPSRLAKLGDKSGIKKPKSIKEPKIPVKGMKKGKGKGKGGHGPRPADLPPEFDDWTEKDLDEAGLTWKDLMPLDDDVGHELQRIEDEEMGRGEDEELDIDRSQYEAYDDMDLDAMLREAEADLATDRSVYEEGVGEDEPIVELFDDEIEDIDEELNISRTARELRGASPAITSGIPVTTPQRSASPKRFQAPEKVYAEEDDDLLAHRYSPLRPPKERRKEPKKKRPKKPSEPTDKDPNISKVFKEAKKTVKDKDEYFLRHEREFEQDDEFERLERQFEQEVSGRPCPSRSRAASPSGQTYSPGDDARVRQRAQEQEEYLRNLSPPRSPGPGRFEDVDEFEMLERQFQQQAGGSPCPSRARSPGPGFSPGDAARVRQRAQEQEEHLRNLSPPRSPGPGRFEDVDEFEMLERQFQQQAGGSPCPSRARSPGPAFSPGDAERVRQRAREQEQNLRTPEASFGSLGHESPCAYRSPPPLSEEEEFEMLENLYQQQQLQEKDQYGDLGHESFPEMDESSGIQSPPRALQDSANRDLRAQIQKRFVLERAKEQEALLRQGSPQAIEIIRMVEKSFEEDLFKQLAEGQQQNLDESAFYQYGPQYSNNPPRWGRS